MLIDRLKTSAVLLSVVGLLIYLDANHSFDNAEGLWLIPLLLFFAIGTASDLSTMLTASGRNISRSIAMFTTAMVTLSACVPMVWPLFDSVYPIDCPVGRLGWIVAAAIAAVMITLAAEMWTYGRPEIQREKGYAIDRTLTGVFVSMYVGLPMALLVSLRSLGNLDPSAPSSGNWGLAALITMIAVTKSADAGAYFVGRAIGRHKLIPRLSPGKTWEGVGGGILTSTIVAFACLLWLFPALAPTASAITLIQCILGAIVLGPVLAIAGMMGDLAESLVKRDAGVKDSGSWLPGLGGVWDVTDSLIAAVMPAFLCFAAGVAGPPG
ncbi:phosphatidate cytidylyltransferase [Novipirellula sp. SH528]|uniref:phosphatidate cytidylyltransferase n=1 Tax=Novipirellula sp. SH528 TaxID=3454466 RepID=UPI003FA0979F